MPRTKNHAASPAAARSAAHGAPSGAPVPSAGTAPGDPAAAVTAALAAHPDGATTAVIAGAAAISRAAARDALAALETAGAAERTRGGRAGIPDTWRPAAPASPPAPDTAAPAASPEPGGPASHPAAANAASDAEPAQRSPAPATAHPGQDDTGRQDTADDIAAAPPDPAEAAPARDGDGHPAGDSDSADAPPDPAITAQLAGHAGQIANAAAAINSALQAGDLRAALAGIEEISDQAGQARRTLKAALGGAKAHAARPGGLREKVAAHLRGHPGQGFTPHDIHKVLGNSSGAIANALDTLVKLGEAELATEKPRKFRQTATAALGGAATAGDPASDGETLAGAAGTAAMVPVRAMDLRHPGSHAAAARRSRCQSPSGQAYGLIP